MSMSELLGRVTAAGGRLVAEGVRLRVLAPAPLDDEMMAEIRARRWEILQIRDQVDLLTLPDLRRCPECGGTLARIDGRCATCWPTAPPPGQKPRKHQKPSEGR